MAEFVMPILGANMQAGTLTAWRKRPGDRLQRGDIIAEVETDKANVEVEVFTPGVLERLLVEPGQKVPVGTPLAVILGEGEAAKGAPPAVAVAAAPPPPAVEALQAPARAPAREAAPGGRLRISPSARQLAAELGVDLATVVGTGPDGRIMRRDIERAAAPAPTAPPAAEERRDRMRRAIAAAMERSAREIPQYQLSTTIDMSRALEWLVAENERRPLQERLLPGVLFIKATALALREVAELNGVWEDGKVRPRDAIHVGIAISLRGGGLVAPALHDADRRSLDELMRGFRDLVQRARAGSLRSSELSDPTITVTSLGDQGVETVFGLVAPSQSALVGFGRIADRPWAVKGGVVSRPLVNASLSADHRASDGHLGSRFLAAIDRLLQHPEQL